MPGLSARQKKVGIEISDIFSARKLTEADVMEIALNLIEFIISKTPIERRRVVWEAINEEMREVLGLSIVTPRVDPAVQAFFDRLDEKKKEGEK